jgi:hypothetical protein
MAILLYPKVFELRKVFDVQEIRSIEITEDGAQERLGGPY